MSDYKNSIQLSVKIDPQNKAQKDLETIIGKLNKTEINLSIGNQAKESLSSLSKSFDVLYSKSNKSISLDSLTRSAEESSKVFQSLSDEMGKMHEKSDLKINTKNGLKEAKEVNRVLKENYEDEIKLANQIQNEWDKVYSSRLKSEKDALAQIEANEKKSYNDEISRLAEKSNAEQKLADQIAKGREKSEIKSQQVNTTQELEQAKKINSALEDNYKLEQQMAEIRSKADNNKKQREIQEQIELNRALQIEEDLVNQMANSREKSNVKSQQVDRSQELAQAKAINQALEDSYKSSLKEADAQKQVQQEIQKQIKLLEIQKSSLTRQYGNKIDTSDIDKAISKLKSMDNVNMKDLRNEISNIGIGIKDITEKAKSSEGVLGKLGSSLKNVGIYFDVGDIFRSLVNGAKEAINYVMDVENSMIDLRRVVTMSDDDAQNFQNNMHNISMELASTNANTISSVATFAKLGYSLKDATNLGEIATKYNFSADINDINSATTSLIATLKGFGLEASNAIKITDEINQVSNNYAVKAIDINEMLSRSSATLGTFGNSLEESIALGSTANEIMQNASTVGQALKSIAPRLTTNSNALKQLKEFNIGIEDSKGNLKSTYQIFKELAPIMKDLKGEDLAQASNNLFGKQNISTGLSVIKNAEQLDNIMKTLKDSTGSVDKEFDRYLNSTKAKISQLKESLGGLYSQFINSTMTKGAVGGLNSFVTTITTVISKLGTIPSVIATVVGSMTIFNSKFRESMTSYQPSFVTNWNKAFTGLKSAFGEVSIKAQENVTATRKSITAMNEQGNATLGAKAKLVGYQTQLGLATVAEKACAVGAQVMGVAFNMALGLGIGIAIQAITSFISRAETLKQTNQELLSSIQSIGSDTKEIEELKNKFTSLSEEIEKGGLSAEATKTKKQELIGVYDQLIQKSPELKNLIDLESGSYDKQVESIQSVIDKKNEEMGLKAEQYVKDNNVTDSSVGDKIKEMNRLKNELSVIEKNLERTDLTDSQKKSSQDYATNLKTDISELKTSLGEIITVQDTLNKVGSKYGVSSDSITSAQKSIDSVKLYGQAIEDNTDKTNKNTKAKIDNNNIDINVDNINVEQEKAEAIAKSTEEYQKSTQAIAKAQGYIDRLNKAQAMTPTLAKQIAKAYPEIGEGINSVSTAQEYLNNKIQEQATSQEANYLIMKGDDEQFYKDKISNNDSYQSAYNNLLNAFTADGEQAYNVDFGNYKTLNQLKNGTMSDLGISVNEWLKQFVDVSADGYAVDLSNFESIAQAKKAVLSKLNEEIKKINSNLAGVQAQQFGLQLAQNNPLTKFDKGPISQENLDTWTADNTKKIDAYKSKLKGLNGAIQEVDTTFDGFTASTKGFSGGDIGGASDFGGTSGGSDKSAKKAQELAEDIAKLKSEIEPDRYLDFNNAIKQADNELSLNKTLLDSLKEGSPEYQQAELKNIEIYKQKQIALASINDEQKKEAQELKTKLANLGFEFDANGKLINSQRTLLEMQEQVNSMGGNTEQDKEAKQDAIKNLKKINDETKEYIELVGDKIPKITAEWQEQANAISKVKEEMKKANLEILNNAKEELAQNILKDAQEEVENLKKIAQQSREDAKKSLEDERDAKLSIYDEKIKSKQQELEALDSESNNNEEKLKKLQTELAYLKKDNSTEAQGKIQDINSQISEVTKTIKKDTLNKEIDALNDKKQAESDSYDKELTALEKANKEQEALDEIHYKKMLNEKDAYAKAENMITQNQREEMYTLYEKYSESYKTMGIDLSTSIEESLKKISDAISNLNNTEIKDKNSSGGESSSSSSSSNAYSHNNEKTTSGTTSSGKSYTETTGTYGNGTNYTISKTDTSGGLKYTTQEIKGLGTVTFAGYETGGRTPSDIPSSGKLGVLHASEKILNADDTIKFDNGISQIDQIYNMIKSTGSILSQQLSTSNGYSIPNTLSGIDLNKLANSITNNTTDNSNSSSIEINNTYQVDATSDFNTKNFSNNLDKQLKNTLRRFGRIK